MDWYCALGEHMLEEKEPFNAVLQQLEKKVIALYKALLRYQMESVCSYYRHQGLVFLRSLANWDNWGSLLNAVIDAETSLVKDSDAYERLNSNNCLGQLVKRAEEMEALLGDIHQDIRQFIEHQKLMQMDEKDKNCFKDLFLIDPQDDMDNIENKKDVLLDNAFRWILDTREYVAFTDWSNNTLDVSLCRLLWVKGDAGTGKTMLLIGIVRELSKQSAALSPNISHFFCQGTEKTRNSATAALRTVLWQLLVQQPHLIFHLRSKHENAGSSLFNGETAFIALSKAFQSMLKDPCLCPVYFIIDALDECEQGLADLVKLISGSLTLSTKVKWLVSSRPSVELKTPDIEGSLVELDAQTLKDPVNAYIDHKLSILKTREGYDDNILAEIADKIQQRAENTFLWVALVFKALDQGSEDLELVHGQYALEIIDEFPSGLSKLYNIMMTKIEKGLRQDPHFCKAVLVAVVLAYRPLTLSELIILTNLPSGMHPRTIIRKCSSFLTIKEKTVYLVHQSAKDYLDQNFAARLYPTGIAQGHIDIGRRSIDAISRLRRGNGKPILKQDIYDSEDFGFKSKDARPPDPDPLAPLRYSCVFWADHLCFESGENSKSSQELTDEGVLFSFLEDRLLHWLESLSLLGKLFHGAVSLRTLLRIVKVMYMIVLDCMQLLTMLCRHQATVLG
jgi:hypothetical protein